MAWVPGRQQVAVSWWDNSATRFVPRLTLLSPTAAATTFDVIEAVEQATLVGAPASAAVRRLALVAVGNDIHLFAESREDNVEKVRAITIGATTGALGDAVAFTNRNLAGVPLLQDDGGVIVGLQTFSGGRLTAVANIKYLTLVEGLATEGSLSTPDNLLQGGQVFTTTSDLGFIGHAADNTNLACLPGLPCNNVVVPIPDSAGFPLAFDPLSGGRSLIAFRRPTGGVALIEKVGLALNDLAITPDDPVEDVAGGAGSAAIAHGLASDRLRIVCNEAIEVAP
jgi:hypothetical protein